MELHKINNLQLSTGSVIQLLCFWIFDLFEILLLN